MLECVIVGAGVTGLFAAREFLDSGKDFVVLEARDRVGGRVESIDRDGQLIELGGQWVSPGHDLLLEAIEESGAELIAPNDGALLIRSQGTVMRSESSPQTDHLLTPFEIADLGQGTLRIRRLSHKVATNDAWAKANHAWLNQPLMRWIETNLRTPAAKRDFTALMSTAYGDISTMALIDALSSPASLDLESLFAATGALKQRRVSGGMAKVMEHLASGLGDRLHLSTEVTGVNSTEDGVEVVTADGEKFMARSVILTLPPWLATNLEYNPPLPRWRVETSHKTTPGIVVKAFAIYDTPWWREEGLSGQMSADEGPVRVTFDVSDEGKGVIMGFFEGDEADSAAARSESLRARSFEDALAQVFGPAIRSPHDYVDRNWAVEPYSLGSHGAHFAPGIWTANGQVLSEHMGRVHFAGAEFAGKFNGYLEGGARSGRDEAREIIRSLDVGR